MCRDMKISDNRMRERYYKSLLGQFEKLIERTKKELENTKKELVSLQTDYEYVKNELKI